MNKKNSNWKVNVFVIAAAAAAMAAPAWAQDITLKATVPFAFSINKDAANLAPGKYVLTHDGSVWRLRSEETSQSVAIVNFSGRQGQAAEKPALSFDCLGTHCQLRAIHTGGSSLGAEVPAPPLSNADKAELGLVSVSLKPVR
jgi:hypothetical protein